MRICILGSNLSIVSGHARPAYELAHGFANMGHHVTVIAPAFEGEWMAREQAILSREGLTNFEIVRPFRSLTGLARDGERTVRRLLPFLRDADILHCYDLATLWLTNWLFGRQIPCSTVCTVASDPRLPLTSALGHGIGVALRVLTTPAYLASTLGSQAMLSRLTAVPDRIIATSEYVAGRLSTTREVAEKTRVVLPPLRWERIGPPADKVARDGHHYLYFGWMSALRGSKDVLAAFERVAATEKEVHLTIAARGESESIEDRLLMHRLRRSRCRDRITFTGFEADLASLFRRADSVLLPFRSPFGYSQPPMTLLETMSAGKAVITTRVGSIPEIATHGLDALLVPPGDLDALVEHMLGLRRSPELVEGLGAEARRTMVRRFSLRRAADETLAVYDELLSVKKVRVSGWDPYGAKTSYSDPTAARAYDSHRFATVAGRGFDRREKAELRKAVRRANPGVVLEVGAGTGRLAAFLAREGQSVIAVDVSWPMLAETRNRLARESLSGRVDIAQADAFHLPFRENSIDLVCSVRVVNQIYDDEHKAALLRELYRVVKPGGYLFFDLVNRDSLARLMQPAGLVSAHAAVQLAERAFGGQVVRLAGLLLLSQTALDRVPKALHPVASLIDDLLCRAFPSLCTRVYLTVLKPHFHHSTGASGSGPGPAADASPVARQKEEE